MTVAARNFLSNWPLPRIHGSRFEAFLIWNVRFHCDFEVSYSFIFLYMVCSLYLTRRNNIFVYKVTKKKYDE